MRGLLRWWFPSTAMIGWHIGRTVGAPGGLFPISPFVIHSPNSTADTQFCLGPLQTTLRFYPFASLLETHLLCEHRIVQNCTFFVVGTHVWHGAGSMSWDHRCMHWCIWGYFIPRLSFFHWDGACRPLIQAIWSASRWSCESLPLHRCQRVTHDWPYGFRYPCNASQLILSWSRLSRHCMACYLLCTVPKGA